MLYLDQKLSIIDQLQIEIYNRLKQALNLLYIKYYTVIY